MNSRTIFLLFMILVLTAGVFSQASGTNTGKEQTVEELFLQDIEIRIVREQANSTDRDMKLLAIASIGEMIENDSISEGDAGVHSILDGLAEEGTTHLVIENKRVVNYFPEVRRQACEMLGKLGGEISAQTLMRIVVTDNEPMVKSQAAYALGEIGYNENNDATEAIAYALIKQDGLDPDDNFAIACAFAFEKIAEANDGITDSSVFDALILVAQGNYGITARKKAHETLKTLGSY